MKPDFAFEKSPDCITCRKNMTLGQDGVRTPDRRKVNPEK